MQLFTMTYKERQVIRQGMIEASTMEKAEELGREYCVKSPQRKYIGMKDAVLMREEVPPIVDKSQPLTAQVQQQVKKAS